MKYKEQEAKKIDLYVFTGFEIVLQLHIVIECI